CLKRSSPEEIYKAMHPVIPDPDKMPAYLELPLGQGNVPFDRYLAALWDIGYRGYLTIERECGDNPSADIAMAVDFLKSKMN
ncbi:MAG: sugar phosphate isomerase/epimerase, partial [Clostridia bacterium]|nr:sugar phosphate isomerase/epimerase [Clostridia bacterium]